jgi:hypothetical protein
MPTMTTLETVQSFLQEKVTPTIKLQKPSDSNIMDYTLVNPEVHIGWIPPKGYLPEGMESAIPCLIVGMDDGSEDDTDEEFNLRISAAVYSPGLHEPDKNGGLKYTPDFQGYRDLVNFIDRTLQAIRKNPIIKGKVKVKKPIKSGMYQQEQPYPYWYGWITFTVSKTSIPPAEIVRDLL